MRLSATECELKRNGVSCPNDNDDVDRRREEVQRHNSFASVCAVFALRLALSLALLCECELNVTQDCNAAVCTVYKRFVTAVRRANAN
jgi:hypothetical protein